MATISKNPKREQTALSLEEQIGRLQSQIARLKLVIRKLKAGQNTAARETRPTAGPGKRRAPAKPAFPALPSPDAEGNYPAMETLRVILARQIIRRRIAAGWTQAELAGRAGVRQETVSRIETGQHAPNVRTVDKLDRALQEASV
jgi:ribosome-binding protein aMBF1 (putative translation factor)